MTRVADGRLDTALRRLIAVVLLGGTMGIGTSLSTTGWVSTGYLLALTVAIPITGWAVGRFGAKRLWIFGLGLFLLASLASALAGDVASLLVFRVVQGLGAGILDPLLLMILAQAAGPARAGRVMGLMGIVLSSGPVLGLIVGGVVLDALSWQWMFFINLPLGLVALRCCPPTTSGTPHGRRGSTSSVSRCSDPASRCWCSPCRKRPSTRRSRSGRC